MGCSSGGGQTTTTQQSANPAAQAAYTQVMQQANNVAQTPYQSYTGPLVSGFSPDQLAAMGTIQNAQGIGQPYTNAASDYFQTGASPIQSMSFPDATSLPARGLADLGTQQGYLNQGLTLAGYTPMYSGFGIQQAQQTPTYQAGATAPINLPGYDQLSTYFNPYQQQVTQATQNLFNQQNAQQLQQVRGNATTQNAYGGDREAVAEALTAQQQQLAEAPTIAGIQQQGFQQSQQELNNQQQLQLQRQQAERNLSLGAGQLGLSAGQLGLGAGQLNLGAANPYLSAGQQELAAAQGLFGEYNAQNQAQIGAQEASGWLQQGAGYGLANLGQQAQNQALTGANAQLGIGQMEQGLGQQMLNVPYQQFVAQQAYPFQTTGWLANLAEGIGSGLGGSASTTTPGPSLFGQLAGVGTAGAGLIGAAGGFNGLFGNSGMADSAANIEGINSFGGGSDFGHRGGRMTRAAGGASLGLPPAPFTSNLGGEGVPDVSLSYIPGPVSPGSPHGLGSTVFQPNTTTTSSGGGGGGGILGALGTVAGLVTGQPELALAGNLADRVTGFNRGGTIPGYDLGGAPEPGMGGGFTKPPMPPVDDSAAVAQMQQALAAKLALEHSNQPSGQPSTPGTPASPPPPTSPAGPTLPPLPGQPAGLNPFAPMTPAAPMDWHQFGLSTPPTTHGGAPYANLQFTPPSAGPQPLQQNLLPGTNYTPNISPYGFPTTPMYPVPSDFGRPFPAQFNLDHGRIVRPDPNAPAGAAPASSSSGDMTPQPFDLNAFLSSLGAGGGSSGHTGGAMGRDLGGSVPDVSQSFIPNYQSQHRAGPGLPNPPQPPKQDNPAQDLGSLAKSVGKLFHSDEADKAQGGAVSLGDMGQGFADGGPLTLADKLRRIDQLTADRWAAERGDRAVGSPISSFATIASRTPGAAGYDLGGQVEQAGQSQTGGMSTMQQGILSQYLQLPMETLQQMALRSRGSNTPQAQAIQRALQVKKMNPTMGMEPQGPQSPTIAAPQAPTAPGLASGPLAPSSPLSPSLASPMMGSMWRGGSLHRADGGDTDPFDPETQGVSPADLLPPKGGSTDAVLREHASDRTLGDVSDVPRAVGKSQDFQPPFTPAPEAPATLATPTAPLPSQPSPDLDLSGQTPNDLNQKAAAPLPPDSRPAGERGGLPPDQKYNSRGEPISAGLAKQTPEERAAVETSMRFIRDAQRAGHDPYAVSGDLGKTPEQAKSAESSHSAYGPVAQKAVDYADYYGLPRSLLLKTFQIESGMGSNLGQRGNVGQLGKKEWQEIGGGNMGDLDTQVRNGALWLLKSQNEAKTALGREPQDWETYVVHQQGQAGGPALLNAPKGMSAVDALTPAYNGNRATAEAAIVHNGGDLGMSAQQFAQTIKANFEGFGKNINYGATLAQGPLDQKIGPDGRPRSTDLAATPASYGGIGKADLASLMDQIKSMHHQPQEKGLYQNPWMPLVAAGFGMMASRNPHALGAIGEGGLTGVKALQEQDTSAQKSAMNEVRAQALDAQANNILLKATQAQEKMELYGANEAQKRQIAQQNANSLEEARRLHAASEALRIQQTGQLTGQLRDTQQQRADTDAEYKRRAAADKEERTKLMSQRYDHIVGPKDPNDASSPIGTWYTPRFVDPANPDSMKPIFTEGGAPHMTAKESATVNLVNELKKDNPGMKTSDALLTVRDPAGKSKQTLDIAIERLAQSAAKTDVGNDPRLKMDERIEHYRQSYRGVLGNNAQLPTMGQPAAPAAGQQGAPAEAPPVPNAKKAPDGKWYVPMPNGGWGLVGQ